MNLPYFISKRITSNESGAFSSVINRIAVVSIALGTAALLLAFMILIGFQNTIKNKIYNFSGHLLVSKYSLSTSYEETSIGITDSLEAQLDKITTLDHWQYYAFKAGLLKTKEEVQGVILKGVDDSFDTTAFSNYMVQGRFPRMKPQGYSLEVALSTRIAGYLGLELGERVLIYFVQNPPRFRRLDVVGIYQTDLEEFDEKVILGDLNLIRRINNWPSDQVGGIELFVKDPDRIEEAEDEVFRNVGFDLRVDNARDKYIQIFDWLSLLNRNVVIFLVIILFVSGFSMVSILLILIMERTQMVGLLKAMGADNQLIRQIFLTQGFGLIVKGLAWGNGVALAIGFLQERYQLISLDPSSYYMDYVPVTFNGMVIIGINALVILLIGLSLFIPLSVISRIRPIRSIKFD
ncbi:MAG: ABC transporter permease [Cyclobacteriaceae bacterium]|nr:ABC transporter permease [Cyclobacteriaceae bacterium HetDA_MAG_MS6]